MVFQRTGREEWQSQKDRECKAGIAAISILMSCTDVRFRQSNYHQVCGAAQRQKNPHPFFRSLVAQLCYINDASAAVRLTVHTVCVIRTIMTFKRGTRKAEDDLRHERWFTCSVSPAVHHSFHPLYSRHVILIDPDRKPFYLPGSGHGLWKAILHKSLFILPLCTNRLLTEGTFKPTEGGDIDKRALLFTHIPSAHELQRADMILHPFVLLVPPGWNP